MHVFEHAKLGTAPFRFVEYIDAKRVDRVCDYCGTAIRHLFIIKSSDERSFVVGSECVYKTHDSALVSVVEDKVREIRREAARARADAKREEMRIEREAKRELEEVIRRRADWSRARTLIRSLDPELRVALDVIRTPNASKLTATARIAVRDMRFRVARGFELTPKQDAYLRSIKRDAETVKCPVPVDGKRIRIEGKLASATWSEERGWRMTIAVDTPDGTYKVWGSVPVAVHDALIDAMRAVNARGQLAYEANDTTDPFYSTRMLERPSLDLMVGMPIAFDAMISKGDRDPAFGFYKRPTKVSVTVPPAEELAALAIKSEEINNKRTRAVRW